MHLRPKTIDRAILKELFISFAISCISLNFLLMTEKLLRLTRILSSVGISLIDVLRIAILIQPALLVLTTPLALLMAVLLTYGRLNMDNELTAMRAIGMSFFSITFPVRILSYMCFLATLFFSFYLAPLGSQRLRETVSTLIAQRAPYAVEEGVFNTTFPEIVLYVGKKPSLSELKDIFIYDERDTERPLILYSKEATLSVPYLELRDGIIHISKENSTTEIGFKKYRFALQLTRPEFSRKRTELSTFELLREAKKIPNERTLYLIEFHRRFTFPLLCLIIAFLAPPLSLIAGKTGRFGGLTIGLGVFSAYYAGTLYGERLATAGLIPPYIGSWVTLFLTAILSYIAFRKASKR